MTAVRTHLVLENLQSSRSDGALGSRMQTLNNLFIQRTDIRRLQMVDLVGEQNTQTKLYGREVFLIKVILLTFLTVLLQNLHLSHPNA